MDVRGKLIKICFREFCDIAGDSPCGCDGCPYGEYDPDNGGCFDEYKKDKIEKLENDIDKYQKEDNGVTVQEWIPVEDRLPEEGEYVLCVLKGFNYGGKIQVCKFVPADKFKDKPYFEHFRNGFPPVTHWMPLPQPPKGE